MLFLFLFFFPLAFCFCFVVVGDICRCEERMPSDANSVSVLFLSVVIDGGFFPFPFPPPAFFKFQTKPNMTPFGDIYAEGKENDAKLRLKRPGKLSEELRQALGLKSALAPPPWLTNMQRYGLPPSYANMHIPGLNVPIPPGARYGYAEGEWGKPPVDESGQPVYGDPFGVYAAQEQQWQLTSQVEKTQWGALQADAEAESSDDDDDEDEEEDEEDTGPDMKPSAAAAAASRGGFDAAGMASMSGLASTAGLQTPDDIELRKRGGAESTLGAEPLQLRKELYTVLEQKEAKVGSGALYGSAHTYALPSSAAAATGAGAGAGTGKAADARPDFVKTQLAAAAAVEAVRPHSP